MQGKSFILNQLLGRSGGFEVAPTHRPCTKGGHVVRGCSQARLGLDIKNRDLQ